MYMYSLLRTQFPFAFMQTGLLRPIIIKLPLHPKPRYLHDIEQRFSQWEDTVMWCRRHGKCYRLCFLIVVGNDLCQTHAPQIANTTIGRIIAAWRLCGHMRKPQTPTSIRIQYGLNSVQLDNSGTSTIEPGQVIIAHYQHPEFWVDQRVHRPVRKKMLLLMMMMMLMWLKSYGLRRIRSELSPLGRHQRRSELRACKFAIILCWFFCAQCVLPTLTDLCTFRSIIPADNDDLAAYSGLKGDAEDHKPTHHIIKHVCFMNCIYGADGYWVWICLVRLTDECVWWWLNVFRRVFQQLPAGDGIPENVCQTSSIAHIIFMLGVDDVCLLSAIVSVVW